MLIILGKRFYQMSLFMVLAIYCQKLPALSKKSDGASIIKLAIAKKRTITSSISDSDQKQFNDDMTQLLSKGTVTFSKSTCRILKMDAPLFRLIEKATTADYFEFYNPKTRTLDDCFFTEEEYGEFTKIIFFPRLFVPLNEKNYLSIVELYAKSNRILFNYYSQGGLLDFLRMFSELEITKLKIATYAVDNLSHDEALQALKLYAQVYPIYPTFTDILKNERTMWLNTIKRSMKEAEKGTAITREKIVTLFEKKGADPVQIEKIRSGKLLSVTLWREKSCTAIIKEFDFMIRTFDTYDMKKYQNLDKIQQAKAATIYNKTLDDYFNVLKNLVTTIVKKNITLPEAVETWNGLATGIANTFLASLLNLQTTQIKFSHTLYSTVNRLIFIRIARKALGHKTTTPLADILKAGLVPEEVLIDPFSGKRFNCIKDKSGEIIVYSVFSNQIDNHGNGDDVALDYIKLTF
ncbi:MAG: hypothetical protein L3J71_02015 [Victivallaceae bacterium]|nr:hypothetical protein [Victivallaceae bacterium]